jgi:hypothetical protein
VDDKASDVSRRTFLNVAAGVAGGALAAGKLGARTAPQGANDRVRMALIGTGNRGREVSGLWLKNLPEISYVAGCDVYKKKLDMGIKELTDNQKGAESMRTRIIGEFSTARTWTQCTSPRPITGTARS